MKITEYDATSGETTVRDATAAEQTQRDKDIAAAEAEAAKPPVPTVADRLAAVEERLDKAANATVTGEAAKLRDNLKPTT